MILLRQAVRSVWRSKKSYFACVILMAVGIAVYVSFNLLFVNLTAAMDSMYSRQRFGDGFATVNSIPLDAVDKAASITGIRQLDATIVADARVQKPDSTRITTLRLSSFQPGEADRLNSFILVEGTLPTEDGVLISDVFAAANGWGVGDSLDLVVEGRKLTPVITGTVQSPEYVYAIPDTGQMMPDNEVFGFGYMTAQRLGTLTGKSGFATNLSFLLEDGAAFANLKPQLEDALAPYGLKTLIPRKDQPSHVMLRQELDSLGSMATSFPMVFILMAVIILYIMMGRIIAQERMQIGTLKAFGFSNSTILLHYLGYGAITGLAGGIAGVAMGLMMTGSLTNVYLEFFSLPAAQAAPDSFFVMMGFAIALGAGLLGAFMGVRSLLALTPSEAMRPPAPPAVTGDLLGRLPFFRGVLASHGYMAVRNITRNKFRSAFVVVGVAFSFALTAFMASYGDMFDALLLNQFTKVELYNLKISLTQPTAYTPALEAAHALSGVRRTEAMLELPVELRRNHLKKNVVVTAVETDSSLYKIYDNEGDFTLPPPTGGVILSSSLAEDLQVGRGDILMMKTSYTYDDVPLPVLGIVHSNLGATAYLRLDYLWALLDSPPIVTSLLLDAENPPAVKTALLEADNVAAITDQEESRKMYVELMDSYAAMLYMMQLAGVGIAFAIITNTASISLSERKREYATMRVLGMYPGEIGRVVGFEYWVLALISVPPGILLTRLLKQAMAGIIDNEIFSMPVSTAPSSFVVAAVMCMAAVVLSNWSARRKIARFDMVEVLKERE